MANSAQPATGGATYRVLRELGSRAHRTFAAIREPHELLVVQRFARTPTHGGKAREDATPVSAETLALLLRDARCLAKNWHPNVARVRHVDLAGPELFIATEMLDGVTLAELLQEAAAKRTSPRDPVLALPLLARMLVDVLGGLHGLHGLRDGMNAPLGAIHGELCPANIVVGKDGVARLVSVFRPRPVEVGAASEALSYASPEALDPTGTDDARADIYAVGVILWEALTGRRLWDDTDPARIRARQREEELARPELPDASPFARLADVALRALSYDPALRYRSASEMATELRRIAGTRLAPGSAVAQKVGELAGDRIRARRAELDPTSVGARRRAESLVPPSNPELPEDDDPLATNETTMTGLALAETPLSPKLEAASSGLGVQTAEFDVEPAKAAVASAQKAAKAGTPSPEAVKVGDAPRTPEPPRADPARADPPKADAPKADAPKKTAAPRPTGLRSGPVAFPGGAKPAAAEPLAAAPVETKRSASVPPPVPAAKPAAPAPAQPAGAVAIGFVPQSPFALAPSLPPPSSKPLDAGPLVISAPASPFALAPSLPPPGKPLDARLPEPSPPPDLAEANVKSDAPAATDDVALGATGAAPVDPDRPRESLEPATATPQAITTSVDDDLAAAPLPRRRNLVPLVAGAVGGVALLGIVSALALGGGSKASDASSKGAAPSAPADTAKPADTAPADTAKPADTAPADTAKPAGTAAAATTATATSAPEPATAEPAHAAATKPTAATKPAAPATATAPRPAITATPPARPATKPAKKKFEPQGI